MEDRELLEMAAKAAGIEFTWKNCRLMVGDADMYGIREIIDEEMPFLTSGVFWHALIDDGHALRLCTKLNLEIERSKCADRAYCGKVDSAPWVEYVNDQQDIYAATRRSIVCAAAEIGESMP